QLAKSEAKHYSLFPDLARRYFPGDVVTARLAEWIEIEDTVIGALEVRPRLH
ncbi:MAG: tRNA 2-methylthio-N6-isopentenyl adenosine(37) hydroxylase MiaE, partial [Pseudomonadales bacterium]|nr:tRNA 2-methylthio-N6-isopentenyl adenosine(37) hydroxylase MiaE [Pseudomonadales bacterium]